MQFLGVYIRDCLQISFLISKLLFHLTSSPRNHQKTMDQKNSVFVHFSRSALSRKVNAFVVLTAADYDIETNMKNVALSLAIQNVHIMF